MEVGEEDVLGLADAGVFKPVFIEDVDLRLRTIGRMDVSLAMTRRGGGDL